MFAKIWRRSLGISEAKKRPLRKRSRAASFSYRLRLEPLEDRLAPAIITVTSLADDVAVDGKVTLREAIQAANTDTSADTIVFDPSLFSAGARAITLDG